MHNIEKNESVSCLPLYLYIVFKKRIGFLFLKFQ